MSDRYVPYYLPPVTAEAVERYAEQCKNLGLILDKYVERRVIDDTKEKGGWLRKLIRSNVIDTELARNSYRRWLSMMRTLNIQTFDAALDWRIVVGLGGETVLETDMTLHHLYGIPIIPGSALKGLARACVTAEEKAYFIPVNKPEAERKPSLEETTDHPDIQRIFGMQGKAGTVLFFDALPKDGKTTFIVDIVNPHYPDYYNSLNSKTIVAPANNQSPNPIPFLTVTDTIFTFALGARDHNDLQHQEDVKLVTKWLVKGLQRYGIGGKTSAGYGYFKDINNLVPPQSLGSEAEESPNQSTHNDKSSSPQPPLVDPDLKKAEGYIRELEAVKDVASQIQGYYQKWQQIKSQEARTLLAKAIIDKVRKAKREKQTAERAWYKELKAFLDTL